MTSYFSSMEQKATLHTPMLSVSQKPGHYPRQWIAFFRHSLTPSRLCNGIRENKRRQKVGVQRSHFCIDKLNLGIIIHKLLTFLFIKGILIHRGWSCRWCTAKPGQISVLEQMNPDSFYIILGDFSRAKQTHELPKTGSILTVPPEIMAHWITGTQFLKTHICVYPVPWVALGHSDHCFILCQPTHRHW